MIASSSGRRICRGFVLAASDRCRLVHRRSAADRRAAKGLWRRFRPLLAAGGPALWRPLGAQLGDRGFYRSRRVDRTGRHLGADGVGLNPLHALFDDRPADCSPYSPNSRLFLNALYIDVERVPGFQPGAFEDRDALARLRQSDIVDYAAVAGLKWRALRFAFDAFRADPDSEARQDFEEFRASARRCCRGSPVSRCSGTNSTNRGGNGRKSGGSPMRSNARACVRGRTGARSNSSNSCSGSPTGSSGSARLARASSA